MSDSIVPTLFVGLDVHKDTIVVATADDGRGEVRSYGTIENSSASVERLARRLAKAHRGRALAFCYEAGPCGYPLVRRLRRLGHACDVIAPSMIPRRPGDRVKTDRRDALQLARLLRAGELSAVRVPDEEHEVLRDLSRAREDLQHNERRLRQNLSGFLLRHDRIYRDGRAWTQKHSCWLNQQRFDQVHAETTFQSYRQSLLLAEHQRSELERQLIAAVADSAYGDLHTAYAGLRGIDELAAAMLVAELGEMSRFEKATQMSAFVGLTPSESSSGCKRRQGAITKTGNGHVRRLLVECAQAYQYRAALSDRIKRRYARCSPAVQAIAWKAQTRLCPRFRRLLNKGRPRNVVVTATARELCGFIWAIGVEVARARAQETPTAAAA